MYTFSSFILIMVKNTKGGKGHKKCKNSTNKETRRKIEERQIEHGEVYGVVTKILGSGRTQVSFIDDITDPKNPRMETKLGIVRNSIRRQRIRQSDVVLVSIRTFQKDKVDIIYKYNPYEINSFKKNGSISDSLLDMALSSSNKFRENETTFIDETIEEEEDDEDLDFEEKKKKKRNNENYNDIFNEIEVDDESEEDSLYTVKYDNYGNIIEDDNNVDGININGI